MLKKAKVVNIQFQNYLRNSQLRKSCQSQTKEFTNGLFTLDNYVRSSISTEQTYELLGIVSGRALGIMELVRENYYQKNVVVDRVSEYGGRQEGMMGTVLPQVQPREQDKVSDRSIEVEISKANSGFTKEVFDTVDQNDRKQTVQVRNQFQNVFQNSLRSGSNNCNNLEGQYFYLIPQKYQQTLHLILTHFLNYKLCSSSSKQSIPKTPLFPKRPQTTSKALTCKPKQTFPQPKPFTAIDQNRAQPLQPFTSHLQKLLSLEKQLQKKSKRLYFVQNQLKSSYQTIKQKNNQIKQLKDSQMLMKRKFKYEYDKVMKGKLITDVNDIFLMNLSEQKALGKSIFQINGKKYIKSQQVNTIADNTFMTAPKTPILVKSKPFKQNSMNRMFNQDCTQFQSTKKSQSMVQLKKPIKKPQNRKLQMLKLTKSIEQHRKQILSFQSQKQTMLDKLTENNAKIQNYLEQIQRAISEKRVEIERCGEELNRLKEEAR